MNFNLSMNQQSTQYLQNKINQNNHFLNINQQQLAAPRYIGMSNQFMQTNSTNNTNLLTSSPPLNGQFNNTQNLIGQQQQLQQSLNQNNNFPMVSPNNMIFQQNNNNAISQLNFKNQMSQQQNIQQINNGQNLIASVIAANTTCSLNNTLFVGNLHASLQEIDLVQVFRPFGRIVECCKKWLHFGFVKFTSEEEACHAYVTLNGFRLKGRPMRLEFQNRTKKARIKAILAQAALQASSNGLNCNETMESSLSNMGFPSFLNDNIAHNQLGSISGSNKTSFDQANDCSFFNSDQLIKFANSIEITESNTADLKKLESFGGADMTGQELHTKSNMNFSFNEKMLGKDLIESTQSSEQMMISSFKKYISPSESPQHEFSCSLSSSDSGCRSTASFLAEEDSGIASFLTSKSSFTSTSLLPIKKTKKQHDSCLTEENLSSFNEELNKKTTNNTNKASSKDLVDADENTEVLSVSDHDTDQTSDDASDIPDSECLLDDLASLDDLEDPFSMDSTELRKVLNQVMDKEGQVLRKKLDYGIYRSVNQTMSLFIEPQDVLKKVDVNDYEEYSLFPHGMESVESYLCAMVM
jgi:RNA recognition motif-containing protein